MTGPWYHGTRRGFTKRGILIPRAIHGGSPTTAPLAPGQTPPGDENQWVHFTGSLELAWVYAWHATGRGKPKVLILEPHGRHEPDPEHSHRMDAWRCEWATVIDVLTHPAITEAQARAGWVTT